MKYVRSILTVLILVAAPGVQGATVGGIELPPVRDELQLNGAGLLRKGLFFKVYLGALYLENADERSAALSEVPKRIDIHFYHHTPKKYMIRAANKTLRENLAREEYERYRTKIDQLHKAYLNGEKGSYASITYRPGKGLTYAFDDIPVVTINCDEFAKAYFTVWLGEKPSSRSIKKAMLNNSGKRQG